MTDNFYFAEGCPFSGRELERLKAFLKGSGLQYDDKITNTVCIMDEDTGEIAATGSLSGIILKCVAVSQHYHGKGLLSELMSKLYEIMYNKGTTHFVGFTKPKNLPVFSHMGLYPIVSTEHIVYLENRKDEFQRYLKKLGEKAGAAGMAGEKIFEQELEKCRNAGAPETDIFPGYLIPVSDIPDYFIPDKENSFRYRQELFDKLKKQIVNAVV